MPEASDAQVSFLIELPNRLWSESEVEADWEQALPLLKARYPYYGGLAIGTQTGQPVLLSDELDYLLHQFLKVIFEQFEEGLPADIPYWTSNLNFQVLPEGENARLILPNAPQLLIPYSSLKSAIISCAERYLSLLQRLPDTHLERRHDINWLAELIAQSKAD